MSFCWSAAATSVVLDPIAPRAEIASPLAGLDCAIIPDSRLTGADSSIASNQVIDEVCLGIHTLTELNARRREPPDHAIGGPHTLEFRCDHSRACATSVSRKAACNRTPSFIDMRTIHVEPLTLDSFRPFGSFTDLLNPRGPHLGAPPLEFFRDGLMQNLGTSTNLAHSCCRVLPRPMIIDVLEYHSRTAESMLALDNDMIVQVGPATPPRDRPPLDQLRAFAVPRGTIITLLPGVWHHGPFSPNDSHVHILVCLPERTYANDCIVAELADDERVTVKT